jgi:hypothetical protein
MAAYFPPPMVMNSRDVQMGVEHITADSGCPRQAYTEAGAQHGESEFLGEIVAAKPKVDHTLCHSPEEPKDQGLAHLRDAIARLESKATAEECDDYRRFVPTLANEVATAH